MSVFRSFIVSFLLHFILSCLENENNCARDETANVLLYKMHFEDKLSIILKLMWQSSTFQYARFDDMFRGFTKHFINEQIQHRNLSLQWSFCVPV